MAKRKTVRCPKCSRTFSMQAHLARHMNTIHGAKRTSKAGRRANPSRRPGRTPLSQWASRLGIHSLSLEQLRDVIDTAKSAAKRRLKELQAAFH